MSKRNSSEIRSLPLACSSAKRTVVPLTGEEEGSRKL